MYGESSTDTTRTLRDQVFATDAVAPTDPRAGGDSPADAVRRTATPYDLVPYASYPFASTHPSHIGAIAALMGLSPKLPAKARILEIGCASGGNLLPLAEAYPECELVGIDASSNQIAVGQKTIDALGLRRARLIAADIRTLVADAATALGEFDYIVCHGVYSWVPPDARDAILAVCRACLAPQGVAYVSYNAFPGWRLRGVIRDVMTYHAELFDSPTEKLDQSRTLVELLSRHVPTEKNPYGLLLEQEFRELRDKEASYLLHEYLEETNTPLHFHEFHAAAKAHDLEYLGEADFGSMAINAKPEDAKRIAPLSDDWTRREQYLDFLRNRMFRKTLLCRREAPWRREPDPSRVAELHVATNAAPVDEPKRLDTAESVAYKRPGSGMTTTSPIIKSAMRVLRQAWPETVPFEELLTAARAALENGPTLIDASRENADRQNLLGTLQRCFTTGHVDLAWGPSRPNLRPGAKPVASRLARLQAQTGAQVTNLWHGTTTLDDFQRRLLGCLDGAHDKAAARAALTAAVTRGEVILRDKGLAMTDPDAIGRTIESLLARGLAGLAAHGLLLQED